MSITHSRARQIIQEAFSKKVLQEDGNDQEIEKDALADVRAIGNMINSRLQGKMEWRQGALMFLEFVMEFDEEGATASDLLLICKELMGPAEGNRLYNTLKIMAKVYRQRRDEGTLEDEEADFAGDIQSKIAELGDKGLDTPQPEAGAGKL